MTHRSSRCGSLARAGVALIGAGLVATIGMSAHAANTGPFILLPASMALSDAQLATVRGGFDITPKITVDFAYRQITSVNGTVIAAIAVPRIQIALGRNQTPHIALAPSPLTPSIPAMGRISSSPTPATPVTTPSATGQIAGATPVTTPPATGRISGATPVTTPPATGRIPGAVPATSRYGNTSVSTQFGAGGISTVITNTANNVLIQHHVNVDIGLTGIPAMLASQAHAMVITQAMTDATQRMH